jgi:hypothetical protein
MSAVSTLFSLYRPHIAQLGTEALRTDCSVLEQEGQYTVRYTPFDHVNLGARLVIVGITPGPNQLTAAYDFASNAIKRGTPDADILRGVKREASFGSPSMRPSLIRMLEHFGFNGLLGITAASDLWGISHDLLQATSILPHAVFKKDLPFAGPFKEVLRSSLLLDQFRRYFLSSLSHLPEDALYVGLGPTVLDALDWCADAALIKRDQVVGAFCHPSTQSGSQVDYFLRCKTLADLSPRDPVRRRAALLDRLYARTSSSIAGLRS